MARLLHFAFGLFMHPTKPRGADHGRTRRDDEAGDNTSVDVRAAPPKFATPVRRGAELVQPSRTPKASSPPPNVIPFAKPRALAAISQQPVRNQQQPQHAPIRTTIDPPAFASNTPFAHAPTQVAAHGYSTSPGAYSSPAAAPAYTAPAPFASQTMAAAPGYQPAQGHAYAYAPQPQPAPQPAQPQRRPVTAWPQHVPATQVVSPLPAPVIATPPPVSGNDFGTVPQPDATWAVFDKLGLGKPADWKFQPRSWLAKLAKVANVDAQKASKWLVSAYRLLGFSILTLIVVVLVGYITTTAFFYVSDSWIVPMAVTPNDEKVLTLQAQLSTQQDQRDRIADELNQAERAIAAQQTFQLEFVKAIKGDLAGRRAALGRMKSLASTAAGTRSAIQSQNSAYAGAARKRMKEEYAAGMIDRNAMLNGKFQLAQISGSNLSLAEKQAEYETRAAELEATARSLDAILENAEDTGDLGLSYEVLQIKQQYETSRLELAKAIEARDSLKSSLARQDKIITSLTGSAYLRAINDNATVAFVPYGNLGDVKKGEPLYACKLTLVFCYHVGEVLEVIPGEVQFKHPHRDKNLRGQLVELKLDDDDAEAGMEEHLFVGGKPFWL